jgi:glycosyltransferase involved in cell wall biosynthesis
VKVAFAADQLWFSTPGGIGTYVRELAPALAAEDPALDLALFHCRFTAGGPPPGRLHPFEVVEVPGPVRTLYPRWALLGRPRLPASFDRFDVVHATNPAGVPPVRPGQSLVVTVHDLAFERFPERFPRSWRLLYRAGMRAAARRADAILVPSHATAEDLRALTSVDPAKVHVTPLAATIPDVTQDPAAALARLGVPHPYLLFVGTLEPRKNVVTLVRAYRQVAPDVPHALVLAGPDGWLVDGLDRELARTGPGTIVRTGLVADADLDALYRGADAFAYPSAYEGFGLPVLEALARGVPTVTSDVPALREVAADAALLVEPGDVADLAEALARVLTDASLAHDLRHRGPARAAAYTWAATAHATLEVYRHVTESAGMRSGRLGTEAA